MRASRVLALAAIGVALASAVPTAAVEVVLCRKGGRLTLRLDECRRKETQTELDAVTLDGKTLDEILAPLEARIAALEARLATTTTTVTSSTTTTTEGPGRLSCSCNDDTVFTPCLPHVNCSLYGEVSQACGDLCNEHGGPCEFVPGCALDLMCDNADPTCQS